MGIIKQGHEEEVSAERERDGEHRGLLFQVCLVCTHPGQRATAQTGSGGYLFKAGDNRETKASEGSREEAQEAAGSGSARDDRRAAQEKEGGVGGVSKAEVALSAESNDTRRAGEDAIKVWS